MGLSKKQRKFVDSSHKSLSVSQLSAKLGVVEKEILEYLGQKTSMLESKIRPLGIFEIIKRDWKQLLLISILVIIAYANAQKGDFVSDDYATITQNTQIKDMGNVLFGLIPGTNSINFNYMLLSNSIISILFDTKSPIPFHIYSLMSYLVLIVIAYVFLILVTQNNKLLTLISMIIFALLPVHVEAVSWISGKPYIFSSMFLLLMLIYLFYFQKTQNPKYVIYIFVTFIVSLFCDKVRSLGFFPLFLLYMISFYELKINRNQWFKLLFGFFMLSVVTLVFSIPAIKIRLATVNAGNNSLDGLFYDPFFQYPTSMAKYLQLLVFPIDLTLYHTMYVFPWQLNWLILCLYLALIVYYFFKNRLVSFFLAFIFIATASSMAPLKVSWLVAERYIFLGSLGFSVILAMLFVEIYKKIGIFTWALLSILCTLYFVRIFMRNDDWSTNHKLWVNTCQVSPNSHNAWNNIGDDYDKLHDYPNAVKGFTQSTVVKPDYADAFHNRANIFFKMGRLDLARDSYFTAIKFNPGLIESYISLVQVAMADKNPKEAFTYANELLKRDPNNPTVHYIFGQLYLAIGMKDDARKALVKSLQLDPNFLPAKQSLVSIP